ncbi:Uncharacterised protein [Klebsiella pneumoniae]|nr:hypothetical protein AI2617V1_5055 [Serratia marcescens]CAH4025018.1 hypothetical protein AI2617V1_5055 [Serratia marcescens]SAS94932.1 Uncharacterised protein [Klebsiella pneumoniae]SYL25374.1 Uncharacterised protein [Klebsiella pneumoniae]SYN03783.1 Uncharacterised protein [Klebsiella pneumoniae]
MRISFLRTHVAQQAQCALWAKIGCCLFLATSYRTFSPSERTKFTFSATLNEGL